MKKISRQTARRRPRIAKKRPQKMAAKSAAPGHWVSEREITRLREHLREAQETLDAIRSGEVDAVVVSGAKGNQIYSLTSAEQPYRIYVERMQEGAVTVSADALILYCNQKFADMIQLPLERVIGTQLLNYLNAEAWEKISGIFSGAKDVVKNESVLQLPNGDALPINLTANRLSQGDQNVMCLVVTDLTAQKKLEKIRLAKELAEKANQAKDDFLAALSHELRTPLTPVLMTAIALEQNTELPKEIRESLELIRRNVELEARLIDDLLDLTRIAKGKMALHIQPLDFHLLIQRAVEICRSEFSSKSQTMTLNLDARQHQGEGDSVRIQQAMWNLIRNAAKFTEPKGSIVIRTSNPSPDRISLEVEDTGIGFEPELAGKLFQAFEQGSRQITRQFGGLGLGLAITRSIVEAHGGSIRAMSKGAGQGANFAWEIPLRLHGEISPKKSGPAPESGQKFVQKRILLVEDHKDTRTSLEFLLKTVKHDVKSAATAQEALTLAAAYEFDLVISDIGLPDQSGLELMNQLKNQYHLKGIGLSGYGMEEDLAKGQASGFIEYLTKPVLFEQLKQVIAQTH
jgi:PAS domain S-box-containing protein